MLVVTGCGANDDDMPGYNPFDANGQNINGGNGEPTGNGNGIDETPNVTPPPTPSPTPAPTPRPTMPPEEFVRYNGAIYHVFYHFLAAWPEIAFSNSYGGSLDRDTITPTEYWRSLEQLYANGFVLINPNRAVTFNEAGMAVRAPLYLPPGTRPLVMSFDDINYYTRNLGRGTVDKIVLDEHGRLATSTRIDGVYVISRDNCIVPLLEKFVEQHPGFSPFGDMGMLAITGFDGILGYRTQVGSPNREAEIEAVRPVVAALLANGWYFASHGYGHVWMNNVTLDRFRRDTDQWIDEVASLVGPTNLFVFPYGDHTYQAQRAGSEPKFQYLIDNGFNMFFGVGRRTYNSFRQGFFFQDRANIDGFSLRANCPHMTAFFDVDLVYYPPERLWGQLTHLWHEGRR